MQGMPSPPPGETAYRKLYSYLREQIVNGVYSEGDQLPTEQSLCEQHGVSRITARHAVKLLQDQGFVVRHAGRGTFVRSRHVHKLTIVDGDYVGSVKNELPGLNRVVVRDEYEVPPPHVRVHTKSPDHQALRVIERVDITDGNPVAYDRLYVPSPYAARLSVDLLTSIDFLPRWLDETGLDHSVVKQGVEALPPDRRSIELLKSNAEQPLLVTRETVIAPDNTVLFYVETFYRGDRVRLVSNNHDVATAATGV